MNNKPTNYWYFVGGTLSLFLGLLGLILPVLPTTPFLLLSSFCYYRSSERMHRWINNHPIFGQYIQNYLTHGGIQKKDRIKALVFLWGTLGFSIILLSHLHLRLFLVFIGVAVTLHLIHLKTL